MVGGVDHLGDRPVILIDQCQIFRLVLEPDGVQLGGRVVLLQHRGEPQNVSRIRRQVGFLEPGRELRRRSEVERQRYVLRQIVGRIALPMVLIEAAHCFGCDGCGGRLAGFDQVGAHLGADRRRRLQLLVVAADVHGGNHAKQRLVDVQRGPRLRGSCTIQPGEQGEQNKIARKNAQRDLRKSS